MDKYKKKNKQGFDTSESRARQTIGDRDGVGDHLVLPTTTGVLDTCDAKNYKTCGMHLFPRGEV